MFVFLLDDGHKNFPKHCVGQCPVHGTEEFLREQFKFVDLMVIWTASLV
jgi:hypothetical protein